MSNSRLFSDRRRDEKSPEKSNFAQTCNLLSRYIKGKGSLRDLNLEIGGNVESLEDILKPGSTHAASSSEATNLLRNKRKLHQTSIEEQLSMDSSVIVLEDMINTASTSNERTVPEPESAQLTFFYSGKVLVFDDYPADKARKLVSLAKKESSRMSYGIWSNIIHENTNSGGVRGGDVAATSPDGLPPRSQAAGSGKQPVGISSNSYEEKTNSSVNVAVASCSTVQEELSPQPEANGSDLPIARRSSLHRFLAKRKDRGVARGPYQIQEQPASSPKGGLQIDLNF